MLFYEMLEQIRQSTPYFIFGVPTAMKYTSLKRFYYVAVVPGMSFREVSNSFKFHFKFSTCRFYLQG